MTVYGRWRPNGGVGSGYSDYFGDLNEAKRVFSHRLERELLGADNRAHMEVWLDVGVRRRPANESITLTPPDLILRVEDCEDHARAREEPVPEQAASRRHWSDSTYWQRVLGEQASSYANRPESMRVEYNADDLRIAPVDLGDVQPLYQTDDMTIRTGDDGRLYVTFEEEESIEREV